MEIWVKMLFYLFLGAFDKLKESEFYEAQPNIETENGAGSSKVGPSYKAGTVIVSQRQVATQIFYHIINLTMLYIIF